MARLTHLLTLLALIACVVVTSCSEMCPRLTLENGRVKLRSRNRVAKFRCRRNFRMIEGDRVVTCSLGTWRGQIPKCVGSGCDGTFSIPHGRSLLLFGDALAQFDCERGYELVGSSALSCNGRRWNDTVPRCTAPPHTLNDCDFENPELCQWTLEGEELRWQWSRGPAPVQGAGTRPREDHTFENTSGHYLYVDGSSNAPPEATARLYSPVLQPFVFTPACVLIWVFMRGPSSGELNVYIKPDSEALEIQAPEATLTGHQGDTWRQVYVSLQDIDEPYVVVVEVVYGDGYMSDIAVDDFLATYGRGCETIPQFSDQQDQQDQQDVGFGNDTTDDYLPDSTRPSVIPITSERPPFSLVTVAPATPTTTLPQRTPRPTAPPSPPPTTTKTSTVRPNAVTPPPSASITPKLSTTATTTATPAQPTTTLTTTGRPTTSTASPTTTKIIPPTTTTISSTTTKRQTTKTTTRIAKLTTTRRYVTPRKIVYTESSAAVTAIIDDMTSGNPMPVSDEVKSPEQKSRFSAFLTVLLVSLGIAFLVICTIFTYKKCDTMRQLQLSDDSDVKYLQQGDDDSTGSPDLDSMLYNPMSAFSNMESSPSTSVSSSIGSSHSGSRGSGGSRKPVRPPPPVPLGSQQPETSDPQDSTYYSTVASSSSPFDNWPAPSLMTDALLVQPCDSENNLERSPIPQNQILHQPELHPQSSQQTQAHPPPPPLPPRNYGSGTSV